MLERKISPGVKVLVAGSILQLLLGVIYVWSVFVQPVQSTFGWSDADVKFTVNIMLCCFVLGILAAGKLQVKIKASYIVLTGGMMMAAGMFITSLLSAAAPFWSIWITYGIIGGFGVGLAYNTIISSAQKWFPKKRGLATGISVFTFGFSAVIFAPLVEQLIKANTIGLVSTFQILSIAFLIATTSLFAFIKLPENVVGTASFDAQKQYTIGQMVKKVDFYLIFFSMMFLTAAFFIINPSIRLLAPMHGLEVSFGVTLVMIVGLANSAGRLAIPLLGDKIGRRGAVLAILLITAVGTASLSIINSSLFVIVIALIAFCYGGSSGIFPLVTADHFGLKNVGANYGAVMVGFMSSVLLFPYIIGQLNTGAGAVSADNAVKFIALGTIAAVGALLTLILMLRTRRGDK
ncbi:MFS transporter [Candidatus Bathycorpusculum sp.]|uniref:MFS transporter n=1 Tax=Candidatus Bathycorpusculum sp. TaxID=2994959 RepID=UPI0028347C36|nr:MFS transporter [Candidatus Termitimicrobium sp.]